MKFLVLAADAQSGLVLGVKGDGAICNGMQALTPLPWRQCVVHAVFWQHATAWDRTCMAVHIGAGCSVACLEWCWRIMGIHTP